MIKTTNENIAYYWRKNSAARNGTGAYSTDGKDLYSYQLKKYIKIKYAHVTYQKTLSKWNTL